ncbi:MAG: hypothetical protein FWD17_08345 [Polyangiaceae bacterium]|nr:hypothetical protein [Polyangiaceae bacterium]
MIDYGAEPSKRALSELAPREVREALLRYAIWLTSSEAEGEDLLSDAVACVCDPDDGRPWDPERGSFAAHMRIVLRDLARRERRRARHRREVVDSAVAERDSEDPAPTPDEALSNARGLARLRRLGERLRERLAGEHAKPRALQAFDLAAEGVGEAREQAARLGCSVADIRVANQIVVREAQRVLKEERKSEARRALGAPTGEQGAHES